jgi:hypothetical protein
LFIQPIETITDVTDVIELRDFKPIDIFSPKKQAPIFFLSDDDASLEIWERERLSLLEGRKEGRKRENSCVHVEEMFEYVLYFVHQKCLFL